MFFASKTSAQNLSDARRMMIAGNWKMNKTTSEAVSLSQAIVTYCKDKYDDIDIVLCPPHTDLKSVSNVLFFDKSELKLGAQDVFWEEKGAYTGAISPLMLAELECSYCIVGHSERRQYFAETDECVNLKIKALLSHDITPIMCCGESLETRDDGSTLPWIDSQVRAGFAGLAPDVASRCVIAYEPIWAIGTGRSATPEQAQEVCAYIRGVISDMVGKQSADAVRILYGGSMNPANAGLFLPLPDIDGGLIGTASLCAKDFLALIDACGH